MRAQFVPIVSISTRNGNYQMLDWLKSSYITNLPNLQVQEQYILQAADVPFPELLSYKKYGTTDYWWILLMFNGVIDPIKEMSAGKLWSIPTFSSIQTMLSTSSVGTAAQNQVGQVVSI